MIGVILAAGVGSRLRPMTNDKPKCLVTTAGKTIIQYQIDAYKNAGINELVIVIGYEGGAVRDYCKHIKGMKISIIENEIYEDTNNMYSLYLVREHLEGQGFILNNADVSIDKEVVRLLSESPSENAVAVDTSIYNEESMKVSLCDDGYVNDISKKIKRSESVACSIDFYKFSKEGAQVFMEQVRKIIEDEKNTKDWTEVALQRLFNSGELKFKICDIKGLNWVEIDNYDDLALSDRIFSEFDKKIVKIENFIFDLDGTVYVGSNPVAHAKETINYLKSAGKNIFFISNNSSKSKEDYVRRLSIMGINIDVNQIVLSTDALVHYLRENNVFNIHVLGTNSFKKTLQNEGFNVDSESPEYVVIGYDTELNYQKLVMACKHINDGVDFLATHCDMFCPSEFGPIPDIGSIIEMINLTTGVSPKKIFGKPSQEMIKHLVDSSDINIERTIVVGDRLHTDVLMAKNMSCFSLLVLTGESTRDQLEKSDIKPDFVLSSIANII